MQVRFHSSAPGAPIHVWHFTFQTEICRPSCASAGINDEAVGNLTEFGGDDPIAACDDFRSAVAEDCPADQYASHDYTDLLKARDCQISMSHKASPWENGGCESWMKTLKYEEVFGQEYRDLAEARTCLERFIEKVYNQQRLHSALGYRPPAEFEQALLAQEHVSAG